MDLYILNLGDSRAVVATRDRSLRAVQLTENHTVDEEIEYRKVLAEHLDDTSPITGGRVKGKLKLTRAFGVGYLKKRYMNDALMGILRVQNLCSPPYVDSHPFTQCHRVSEKDEFVVVGSDGLFDFFSNDEVVKLVHRFIQEEEGVGDPSTYLVEQLVSRAAKSAGLSREELMRIPARRRRKYHDDVTVVVIMLGTNNQRTSQPALGQNSSPSVSLQSLLNGNKNSEFCGPLTSFDWNDSEVRRIGTSSIDTTCTIWDIERETVDTQLIAHDKEVYDIAWGGLGVFASVSADGSVRVFDLRDKEHSTIIYESSDPVDTPLVRLGWNKQDPRYMATIIMDSPKVVVLDIRFPTLPVVELHRHQSPVNAIAWAPHSSCHICTAADDSQALIWDLSSMGQPLDPSGLDPILAYTAGAEIEQLQWKAHGKEFPEQNWLSHLEAGECQISTIVPCFGIDHHLILD
ncbi:hypothetical protein Scep_018386 [Stephania cephalantha]|uniref:PPM-type phosphatase domain-containing protein n=1 Tax=Stephania cephalantha TaxID=152367 RepID=A0AAP0NV91_9MAGN